VKRLVSLIAILVNIISASFANEQKTIAPLSLGLAVKISPEYSRNMVNWQQKTSYKALYQLEAQRDGLLTPRNLYISGALKGHFTAEQTNTENKFPNLGRLPSQHNGKSGSEFIIPSAALAITAPVNDWATLFAQLEYTDVAYKTQDKIQLRKLYATIGDLSQSPVYGFFGRKTIDFGDHQSYHRFVQSSNNHSFWTASDAPVFGLGYSDYGINMSTTIIPGGRHLRTASSQRESQLNNFAFNSEKTFQITPQTSLRLGGGYLHSTIYNADFPHHTQDDIDKGLAAGGKMKRVPAVTAYGEFKTGPVKVLAEYATTLKQWPTTKRKLSALSVQAVYEHKIFNKPAQFALSYGVTEIGRTGTEFENMEQFVASYEVEIVPNLLISAEYMRNHGFAPLGALTVPGVSQQSVKSDTFMLGGKILF